MSDSITSEGAGYKKTPANEIGSYESPELAREYKEVNSAFVISDLPTNANSTKRAAPALSASQDSPANTGNLSC